MGDHRLAPFRGFEDFGNLLHRIFGQKAIHHNEIKPFGFDITYKCVIAINEQWFLKIDRLEKSITKSLTKAWIRNEIGIGVHIPQRVGFLAGSGIFPRAGNLGGYQKQIYAVFAGIGFKPFYVFITFVTSLMRYHQFVARIAQFLNQFNGLFNAFTSDNACRLQNHDVIGLQPNGFLKSVRGKRFHTGRIFKI